MECTELQFVFAVICVDLAIETGRLRFGHFAISDIPLLLCPCIEMLKYSLFPLRYHVSTQNTRLLEIQIEFTTKVSRNWFYVWQTPRQPWYLRSSCILLYLLLLSLVELWDSLSGFPFLLSLIFMKCPRDISNLWINKS